MCFVKFGCVTFTVFNLVGLYLGHGFDENLFSSNETVKNFENPTEIPKNKGSKMFESTKGRHFNESLEKIQVMMNGVLTKSSFIPLLSNGSSSSYVSDWGNVFEPTVEEPPHIRRIKPKIKVLKPLAENLKNSTFTREDKKYKLMKNKIKEGNFSKNYLQKRGFNMFPNLLPLLPLKWLTREGKNDSELRDDNTPVWSKLEPLHQAQDIQSSEKIKKLLNLFTIVKFDNGECYAEGIKGICIHESECKTNGGKFTSNCAKELGVCCFYEKTCGEQSKENFTYFVNEGFPAATTSAPKVCTLTLEKSEPGVKQLRLDFLAFQLREPLNGTCFHDRLAITGQDINDVIPEICGENTGQHIYIDVEDSKGPFSVNVITVGEYFPRNFRIKITQLRKAEDLAPKNCLQYYTEPTGTLQTFNYKQELNGNVEDIIPGYFNNLNYAICIKKSKGFCSISYENEEIEGKSIPTFQLVNVDSDGEKLLPSWQAGAETFDCPDDYIVINGIRLCGEKLNDATAEIDFTKNYPVTDTTNGPFVVSVRTDATISGRGFFLKYSQNPCLL